MGSSSGVSQAVPKYFHAAAGAWYINVTSAVCLPIIAIFAGLRIYAKLGLRRKLTWDDLTCTLGILSGIIFISMCLAGVAPANTFTHNIEMNKQKRGMSAAQLRLTLVLEAAYSPFVWFIKLSLFVAIAHIFSTLRWLKYLTITGAIVTGLFYFSAMMAVPILCAPRDGTTATDYRDQLGSSQCQGSFALGITVGVFSVLSDLYLIILPMPAVWGLQLPLRRRLAIAAMFLVGLMALAASTISLYYRIKVSLNQEEVCSFNILPNWLFAIVEMAAGIVVCCMPSALIVFNHIKPAAKSLLTSPTYYIKSKTSSYKSSKGMSEKSSSPTSSTSGSRQRDSAPMLAKTAERHKHTPIVPNYPPMVHSRELGSTSFLWELERDGSRENIGEGRSSRDSDSDGEGRRGTEKRQPGESGIWKTSRIEVENAPF